MKVFRRINALQTPDGQAPPDHLKEFTKGMSPNVNDVLAQGTCCESYLKQNRLTDNSNYNFTVHKI